VWPQLTEVAIGAGHSRRLTFHFVHQFCTLVQLTASRDAAASHVATIDRRESGCGIWRVDQQVVRPAHVVPIPARYRLGCRRRVRADGSGLLLDLIGRQLVQYWRGGFS